MQSLSGGLGTKPRLEMPVLRKEILLSFEMDEEKRVRFSKTHGVNDVLQTTYFLPTFWALCHEVEDGVPKPSGQSCPLHLAVDDDAV